MTLPFSEILEIVNDNSRTNWQKAADLHAALDKLTIAPKQAHTAGTKVRKPRGPSKPKSPPVTTTNGNAIGEDHG